MRRALTLILLLLLTLSLAQAQPIFDYVNKPDPAFRWECVSVTTAGTGCELTNLQLVSQVWQGLTWTHQLAIIQPPVMQNPQVAVLLINGGTLRDSELAQLSIIAKAASAPIVYLGDIPNQPLFGNLREDALIAHTFVQYLKTGDATWPLLFPMTKAAVRAMDAVQQYTRQNWPTPVEKFVVTGLSKRGWTTWFTGEVDPTRVAGIVPIVYDNLNLPAQMKLQRESYGEYSSQIDDYTAVGLPDLLQTEAGRKFGAMVDPYTYRERLTMPKLLIHGTNDPYWVVDSSNIYFDELPGSKYLLNMPNIGHSVDFIRLLGGEVGFYLHCAGKTPFPRLNWHFEQGQDLKLGVVSDLQPRLVQQWTGTSPTRDFRKAQWTCKPLEQAGGQWVAHLAMPPQGYAALFAEAFFELGGATVPLSTTIRVIGAQ